MSINGIMIKLNSIKEHKAFAIAKKVLWAIMYGILGIVVVAVLWLGVDKFILKSPVPSFFGYATLSVETGSMAGEINIGDLILIKDTGDYKIGDIITYIHEGDTIPTTHRIIYYTDDGGFITKGDANNTQDTDSVTPDMIFGEVIKVYPKAGLFSKWVREEGWLYIVAVLIIVALGSFITSSDANPTDKNAENNNPDNSGAEAPVSPEIETSPEVAESTAEENKEENNPPAEEQIAAEENNTEEKTEG